MTERAAPRSTFRKRLVVISCGNGIRRSNRTRLFQLRRSLRSAKTSLRACWPLISRAQVAKELRLRGKLLRRGSKNCEAARRCRRRDRRPKGLLRICPLRHLSLLFTRLCLSVPTNSFSPTSPSISKHAGRRACDFCGGNWIGAARVTALLLELVANDFENGRVLYRA